MNLEGMPPIIVATDYAALADAEELVGRLEGFDRELVGYKVPHWHDQKLRFIEDLLDEGRYVVLDAHLNNAPNKLALSMHAYLEADDPEENDSFPRPHALTLNPIPRSSSDMAETFERDVMHVARKFGVKIVGFSEQTDIITGTDSAVTAEVTRYLNACALSFDGFEVHAANFINPKFLEELRGALAARTRNASVSVNYHDFNGDAWPDLIASKFSLSSIRPYRSFEHEALVIGKEDKLTPEQYRARSITIAGHIFGLGVRAVYLGSSVTEAPDPTEVIHQVAAIRDMALRQSIQDNLDAIHEARLIAA